MFWVIHPNINVQHRPVSDCGGRLNFAIFDRSYENHGFYISHFPCRNNCRITTGNTCSQFLLPVVRM